MTMTTRSTASEPTAELSPVGSSPRVRERFRSTASEPTAELSFSDPVQLLENQWNDLKSKLKPAMRLTKKTKEAVKRLSQECELAGRDLWSKEDRLRLHNLIAQIADAWFWKTGEYPSIILSPSQNEGRDATDSISRSAPVVKGWFVNVPARNDFFTGREEILSKLHAALRDGERVAVKQAISGLGGIGKTQIAIEYAHRYADAYSHVFWVSAESLSALTSGFASLAQELGLTVKQEQSETVAAVKRWMTENSGWLMIFDNADVPEIVTDFIPAPLQGKVLLTSRAQNFDALGVAAPISLDVLSAEEAFQFFLTRTGKESLNEDEACAARELAEEFGWLPLALEQAAAYVSVRKIDFKKYLEMYHARRKDVLSQTKPIAGGATETVATIWRANFDAVEDESPAAADILRINAFFAPDDIPLELLEKGAAEISESVTAAMRTALTVNDVLEPLMRYSLVHLNEANATYGVHRLLQAIMQDAMTEPERREWTERAVRAVNVAFPDIKDFTIWAKCDQFLPHALSIIQWIGKFDLQSKDIVKLLNKIGFFLRTRSRYGTMRPPTEFTSNEWAKWYEQLGWELSKLEDLLGKLREEICSKNQNNENIDTSLCLNNLAYLYESQRSYEKAEKLFKEALAIRKKLKAEPNYIAGSLNNLAEIYFKKGEYEKAEKLYLEALEIRQKAFGKDNDWTAGSLRNLAKLYFYPDFFELKFNSSPNFYNDKVKPHCKETLEIHEKLYSVNHPFTAQSLSNLAYVYQIQKEYKDAELYFTQALKIFEQTQGPEHRDTAASLLSLAKLYEDQKSYKKAESLYERALSIYKTALGPEDINTAFSLNNLARLYHVQELHSKANPLCTQALGILEKALGVEHRRTKKCAELLLRIRHGLDAQGVGAHVVEPTT